MIDATGYIVTGAAGGIGSATVESLLERGHGVVAVDINPAALEQLKGRMQSDRCLTHVADAADVASVESFVEAAFAAFQHVGGAFLNAAIEGTVLPIQLVPVDVFDNVMHVNVRSVFLGLRALAPKLAANGGGVIVNTAGTTGLIGWANLTPYSASKHAVIGLTKTTALEFAASGVRVLALAPGPIDTRMQLDVADGLLPDDHQEALANITPPVGRLGTPAEVARAATWLLCDSPEYLTGTTIVLDGAQTAGRF